MSLRTRSPEAELEEIEAELAGAKRLMEDAIASEAAGGDSRTARASYAKASEQAQAARERRDMLKAVIEERDREANAAREQLRRDHATVQAAVKTALSGQRFTVIGRLPVELQDQAWSAYKDELREWVARRERELADPELGQAKAGSSSALASARALLARSNESLIAESRDRVRALTAA